MYGLPLDTYNEMGEAEIRNWEEFLQKEYTNFQEKYNMNKQSKTLAVSNFILMKTIGIGTYGRVVLAKRKDHKGFCAIKIMEKAKVIEFKQLQHCLDEKRILKSINFPFLVRSEFSFKDNCNLYIVMPFIPGGEMFAVLRHAKRFTEDVSKFYAAQVLLALEYLHHLQIVYRDLKPENLLLGGDGYLKLVDFGFCKIVKTRTYTMCGTAEYMAPEILLSKGYGKAVDWWSFGVLIYEMCVGLSPFFSKNIENLFKSIVEGKYNAACLPSSEIRGIVKGLLQVDPSTRLGNLRSGVADIKSHPWFIKTDWLDIFNKKELAPYSPNLSGPGDISNYNANEDEPLKVCSKVLFEEEFKDF